MNVSRVYRCIKLTSLRDALEDYWCQIFRQLFRSQIDDDWGQEDCRLVLEYNQNVLIDSIFIELQNRLCITINHFTALYLLSVWDLIARLNIPMPTKGSGLKLITSGFSICKVKRMTWITLSKDEFILFLYYTAARLHRIWSSNVRSSCQLGKQYQSFLKGARKFKMGITSSSSRIGSGDSSKVQRSS